MNKLILLGQTVVVKLLEGTQGIGVVLAETAATANSVIEAFHGLDQNILIQKYIREANGSDIRALVVGKKVVAAMRREAVAGEFRANIHRGGKAKQVLLSADYRKTALAAARVLGLRFAGVDMIESEAGPMVMEVNSSPGLEGIQKATGIDVAAADVGVAAAEPDFVNLRHRAGRRIPIRRFKPFALLVECQGVGDTPNVAGIDSMKVAERPAEGDRLRS